MINLRPGFLNKGESGGQSLVEVALFLPILIFMLIGVVEVSTLLNTQNKVTTAARISAGYGAANVDDYDRTHWDEPSPTALEMGQVAINTITQTLEIDVDLWDVWAILALTNRDGTDFDVFTHTHVFGDYQVVSEDEWAARQADVRAYMLEEIQSWPEGAKNLEVIATAPYYAQDTVIGVKIWQWVGLRNVRGLTVMRVGTREPFGGCPILPIAIRRYQHSLYPTNWTPGIPFYQDGDGNALYPGDPVVRFPPQNVFSYPLLRKNYKAGEYPPPTYLDTVPEDTTVISPTTFIANRPGVPLAEARPGYIYFARESVDEEDTPVGAFGWLSWRDDPSANTLADSLTFPGNFLDPDCEVDPLSPDCGDEGYPNSDMDTGVEPEENCNNMPCGNDDERLVIDEWLYQAAGVMNSREVNDALQHYVDTGQTVFLIIYDEAVDTGQNLHYQAWKFAKVRLLGYHLSNAAAGQQGDEVFSNTWILYEFVSWGVDCYAPGEETR